MISEADASISEEEKDTYMIYINLFLKKMISFVCLLVDLLCSCYFCFKLLETQE